MQNKVYDDILSYEQISRSILTIRALTFGTSTQGEPHQSTCTILL